MLIRSGNGVRHAQLDAEEKATINQALVICNELQAILHDQSADRAAGGLMGVLRRYAPEFVFDPAAKVKP